jgi:hypothetical protein
MMVVSHIAVGVSPTAYVPNDLHYLFGKLEIASFARNLCDSLEIGQRFPKGYPKETRRLSGYGRRVPFRIENMFGVKRIKKFCKVATLQQKIEAAPSVVTGLGHLANKRLLLGG